jgi:hypothetical protein
MVFEVSLEETEHHLGSPIAISGMARQKNAMANPRIEAPENPIIQRSASGNAGPVDLLLVVSRLTYGAWFAQITFQRPAMKERAGKQQ